jgi:hypothetical protein
VKDGTSIRIFDGDSGSFAGVAVVDHHVRELHEQLSEKDEKGIGLHNLKLNPERDVQDGERDICTEADGSIDHTVRTLHVDVVARVEGNHPEHVPHVFGDRADLCATVKDAFFFLRVVDSHWKGLHVCSVICDD